MKVKPITSVETALRIYYEYPEIGNAQMFELFGKKTSTGTLSKYKKAALEEQMENGVYTANISTVNTEIAYRVWGIDVEDLERRYKKLLKLGFLKMQNA